MSKLPTKLSVMEFMEDFDDQSLTDYERDEQLMEAVRDYNFEAEKNHDPATELRNYKEMLMGRRSEEPNE